MLSDLVWLNALGPIALLALGAMPRPLANRWRGSVLNIAQGLALLNFLLSLGWLLAVALTGPMQTRLVGLSGVGLGLYLDMLGAGMSVLVSFVGLIVIRYSRNYLDG